MEFRFLRRGRSTVLLSGIGGGRERGDDGRLLGKDLTVSLPSVPAGPQVYGRGF